MGVWNECRCLSEQESRMDVWLSDDGGDRKRRVRKLEGWTYIFL